MKLPKIKKYTIQGILRYIYLIILSSFITALVLIALPLTERVTSSATYDLVNKKDIYWSKEYILELDTQNSLRIDEDINNTKSVIERRLRKIGVEESSVSNFEKDDKRYLRVRVQTSINQEYIDTLVKTPFILNVVTRKEGVNFDDTENPLIPYLVENYEPTKFGRAYFRNIFVTQLKNSANEYSYFALFKTWPWDTEWKTFLSDNSGQSIGVAIDDFVTPMQVPTDPNVFALPVSAAEKEQAKIVSIMYNSGVTPLKYSTSKEDIKIPDIPEIEYIKLTEGILIAVILIYMYLFLIEKTSKSILLLSALSTVITVSMWIAYLKISNIPVDIFILALEVISVIALIRIITENIESRAIVTILLAMISAISIILGSGYIKIFANDLLILTILSNISIYISSYYIVNLRKTLKV